MKKQTLVAGLGTLALAANVLLPSLALGQGSEGQTGTQEITCGALTLTVNATDFSMDTLTVSTSAQDSFGDEIAGVAGDYQSGTTILPNEAFLYVDDARTVGGGAGCATNATNEGWELGASATNFASGGENIANTNFYIVSTTNVTADGGFTEFAGSGDGSDTNVYYTTGYAGTQDVTAVNNLADTADLTTAAPFTGQAATLDSSQLVLDNSTGAGTNDFKFTSVGTGVAYYLNVPANQAGGTYTSTVTFDLVTAT